MDKKDIKHVLSGLSTAVLITGVALTMSNCNKESQEKATGCGQGSCSKASQGETKTSCGQGSCGQEKKKGSVEQGEKKGSCGQGEKKGSCGQGEKKSSCGQGEKKG